MNSNSHINHKDRSFTKNIVYICLIFVGIICVMLFYFVGIRYTVNSTLSDIAKTTSNVFESINPFKKQPIIQKRTVYVPAPRPEPIPAPTPAPAAPPKYMVKLANGGSMIVEHYDLKGNSVELFPKDGFSIVLSKSEIRSISKL